MSKTSGQSELELARAEAARLREALSAFLEACTPLHPHTNADWRYEINLAVAALKSKSGVHVLCVLEAARELRDAARRSGVDETGGPKLKALIGAVDALDVF